MSCCQAVGQVTNGVCDCIPPPVPKAQRKRQIAKFAYSNPILLQQESFLVDDLTFLYCREDMWRTFQLNFERTQDVW